nr:hypothetical protein [Tanacetum cinerariifolium]
MWQLPIGQPPVTWQPRQHRSKPVNGGQRSRSCRRSTPPATVNGGQRRRPPINGGGSRCPTRHTFVHEDISEGGGDFVSLLPSNEALQTPAATAVGGAEDSAALTALSLKLDRCLHRVSTLENELGITKKVLGGAVLKLVTRVKRLEGLLQQRKRRLVLSDSEGVDTTLTEQDIDLQALHTLARMSLGGDSSDTPDGHDAADVPADTSMPSRNPSTTPRRLKKPFSSSASAHVPEDVPAGAGISAAASTIPADSPMDASVHAAAAPSSSIPTAADKGKAPMVDDSIHADLLSEQERVLKNLHDSQLGEELAKKLHAKQEAEFARQQKELAQKAQAERVASSTAPGPMLSDQRRRELDAAQLIYIEADWVDLLAKIPTNSALSKQLLGDDVTEENMNERLGMLLLRAPQVPAASSQVPAGVPAALSFPADVSVHAATYSAPADISVPTVSPAHAVASVPVETVVHTAESTEHVSTAFEHVSPAFTVAAPTLSSSRTRRKHIAKKQVTPIVDMADAAMIKFDSDSDSDDDPFPCAPYADWEMVPSLLGSVHAYHDMARDTKHFTTLRELLYMVEKTDLQKLLGVVDESLKDEEARDFWRNQDSWHIRSWRLYPRAQRMLKHELEVPKLLVGGDLTMAEQLVGFIKAALLNAKSAV